MHRDGSWSLGPIDELDLTGRKGVRERQRLLDRGASAVLGLARDRRLEAVLAVEEEIAPGVETVAGTARDEGLRVLVAGGSPRTGTGWPSRRPHRRGERAQLPDPVGRAQPAGRQHRRGAGLRRRDLARGSCCW